MTVAAVDRAVRLLRALPRTDETLSGLSRQTGLPLATVSRLMGALDLGPRAAFQDESGRDWTKFRVPATA